MNEVISKLKSDFPSISSNEKCKEGGIYISLGRTLSRDCLVINIDKCTEMNRNAIFKKCDCIILASCECGLLVLIIELKTNPEIEDSFEDKFKNCLSKFEIWFNKEFKNSEYDFFFLLVKKRLNSIFKKYLESINRSLKIKGQKKQIIPIENKTCLSDYFVEMGYI